MFIEFSGLKMRFPNSWIFKHAEERSRNKKEGPLTS